MTVVDVLLPDEDDLLVQFMEVFNELSLTGWRICDMPWEMKAERKRSVFSFTMRNTNRAFCI
jgi:hypothetical protein